jgi:hypothetical protein
MKRAKIPSDVFVSANLFSRIQLFIPYSFSSLAMSEKKAPSEFLKSVLGRPVIVKLNSGVEYRGMVSFS